MVRWAFGGANTLSITKTIYPPPPAYGVARPSLATVPPLSPVRISLSSSRHGRALASPHPIGAKYHCRNSIEHPYRPGKVPFTKNIFCQGESDLLAEVSGHKNYSFKKLGITWYTGGLTPGISQTDRSRGTRLERIIGGDMIPLDIRKKIQHGRVRVRVCLLYMSG